MKAKFRLFKSKYFKMSLKYNVPIDLIYKVDKEFTHTHDCGCKDVYPAGWYVDEFLFGPRKLEDL